MFQIIDKALSPLNIQTCRLIFNKIRWNIMLLDVWGLVYLKLLLGDIFKSKDDDNLQSFKP